ncbi:MAG: hypothetical protein SFX72_22270 [Isosphaeraceae bacterium]|nr:hypothetical protein [Isosphaeraceae bacterium]
MQDSDATRVADIRVRLGARAAGAWRLSDDSLVRTAFSHATDMPEDVVSSFCSASERFRLSDVEFGVVKAAVELLPVVSRRSHSGSPGSGRWLEAFDADRSIAVPILDDSGRLAAVFAVALAADRFSDEEVADLVTERALLSS